jgi:elongation factor P--(R)-beta-lysine ligase
VIKAIAESELKDTLTLRARLNQLIREFFLERHVLEVETPMLSMAANTEPNIESFSTRFSGHLDAGSPERWLRTSAEFPLKRLIAAGIGDCYELGRVFRNGEAGRRHNPEFSMLEWYRLGWNLPQLIEETVALVRAALVLAGREADLHVSDYRQLFVDALGIDPFEASIDDLRVALGAIRIAGDDLQRDDWLDLLLTHCIQPEFPPDRITVVHDWPASQCALARIRPGTPAVAERFELYLGQHELANGYHELTDAAEQRARFESDNARRRARGQDVMPLDEHLLTALEKGMPECSGVAVGVDRLLMGMLDYEDIRPLLAFEFARA